MWWGWGGGGDYVIQNSEIYYRFSKMARSNPVVVFITIFVVLMNKLRLCTKEESTDLGRFAVLPYCHRWDTWTQYFDNLIY